MIVYLSHWDWNLYKSRKDIVSNLDEINFRAVCPKGNFTEELVSCRKSLNFVLSKPEPIEYVDVSPQQLGRNNTETI